MVGSGKEKNWAGKGMGNLGPGAGGRLQVSKEYMLRSGHFYKDLGEGREGALWTMAKEQTVGTADAKALRWQWLGVFQNLQRGQSDWSGEGGSNRPGAQRSEAGGYHTKQGLPGTLGFHSWYRRKALEDSVPKGTRSD